MNEHFELIAETGFMGLVLTQPKEEPKEPPRDAELVQESDDGSVFKA